MCVDGDHPGIIWGGAAAAGSHASHPAGGGGAATSLVPPATWAPVPPTVNHEKGVGPGSAHRYLRLLQGTQGRAATSHAREGSTRSRVYLESAHRDLQGGRLRRTRLPASLGGWSAARLRCPPWLETPAGPGRRLPACPAHVRPCEVRGALTCTSMPGSRVIAFSSCSDPNLTPIVAVSSTSAAGGSGGPHRQRGQAAPKTPWTGAARRQRCLCAEALLHSRSTTSGTALHAAKAAVVSEILSAARGRGGGRQLRTGDKTCYCTQRGAPKCDAPHAFHNNLTRIV